MLGIYCWIYLRYSCKSYKKTSPFSLRRLKAMTRDVVYSNKKIAHVPNVKNKYGVQQGIKLTVEWYHQNRIL